MDRALRGIDLSTGRVVTESYRSENLVRVYRAHVLIYDSGIGTKWSPPQDIAGLLGVECNYVSHLYLHLPLSFSNIVPLQSF
jgi:hypothetical protein